MSKTTGHGVQLYLQSVSKAADLNLHISVSHDGFEVVRKTDKVILERAKTIEEVYYYLRGYETGRAFGYSRGLKNMVL